MCARLLLGLSLGYTANAPAQLPALNEAPWLGYFAGYKNNCFTFGISAVGEIKVTPLNDDGDTFGPHHHFAILFGIEEVLPNGEREIKKSRPKP